MSSESKSGEERINERLRFEIRALVAIGLTGHVQGSPQPGDTNITIYKWNDKGELTAVTTNGTYSEYDASGTENGSSHVVNWMLTDAQGTVRDVVQHSDDATTPVNHLLYDAFGQVYSQSSDEAANQSSFAVDGMWQGAAATGPNYDDFRWYDAVDGVFASQDPLGFGGGQTNTEEFVGNSPTNFTDPMGLCDCGCPSPSDPYSPVGLMADSGGSGGYTPVCFAAGTSILLADGTTKAIERIERGDQVRAAFHEDPEGAIGDAEVVEVYHHGPRHLVEVEIGGHLIHATPKHPFYVRNRGWTAAAKLRAGDELRTADGGWIAAGSVHQNGHVEPVYNFQVADLHTYFVRNGAGSAPVLVHNDSGDSGVTLDINPTKPDSMKWTNAKLPPNIGGNTTVVFKYTWNTQTSNTGTVRVRYTLKLVATIQLDPANIAKNKKLTIETAYGHEQLHVKAAISILQQAKTKLETVADTEYNSQAEAEAAAKKRCKQADDWVQKRLTLDKKHKGKDPISPEDGVGYPPIGKMPKGQ